MQPNTETRCKYSRTTKYRNTLQTHNATKYRITLQILTGQPNTETLCKLTTQPNTESRCKYSQCNEIQKCAANTHNATKYRNTLPIARNCLKGSPTSDEPGWDCLLFNVLTTPLFCLYFNILIMCELWVFAAPFCIWLRSEYLQCVSVFGCVVSICSTCVFWWRCFLNLLVFFYLHVFSSDAARWALSATVFYTFVPNKDNGNTTIRLY